MSRSEYDIVVVGAGMAGATLAMLVARGAPTSRVALVDQGAKQICQDEYDSRVVALTQKASAILAQAGLDDGHPLWSRCASYTAMRVLDGEGTGVVDFHHDELGLNQLGVIAENSQLVFALQQAVAAQANIETFFGDGVIDVTTSRAEQQVTLASGVVLTAGLIVAADGGRSPLREKFQIPCREWSYHQKAIVAVVRHQNEHNHCAWQRFGEHGPLAFLPLADAHTSAIVWSLDTPQADVISDLQEVEWLAELNKYSENHFLVENILGKAQTIALTQRHAKEYGVEGLILVGDAAHTIHPLAGQGANLGFYDVHVLAQEITLALKKNVPLSDLSILKRYQRQRQGNNLAVMAAMEAFKRLYAVDNLPFRWLRNTGMRFLNRHQYLRKLLVLLANGGN